MNECLNNNGGCQHVCVDHYVGNYCVCREGYGLVQDFNALNSCPRPPGNTKNLYCLPAGRYGNICFCMTSGSIPVSINGTQCQDVNECLVNNGGCEDTCINTQGSYQCGCPTGFRLAANRRDCEDINECREADPCIRDPRGGRICVNTFGSYTCASGQFVSRLVLKEGEDGKAEEVEVSELDPPAEAGKAAGLAGILPNVASISSTTVGAIIAVAVLSVLNVTVLTVMAVRWVKKKRSGATTGLESIKSGYSDAGSLSSRTFNSLSSKFSPSQPM